MPVLSVLAIRLSLVHLVCGFTLGALLLAGKGLGRPVPLPWGTAAHMALLQVGWTLQLALGVAFWILPRFLEGPPRGDERPAWLAVVCVNAAVLVALAGSLQGAHALAALGAGSFAFHAWPRIRAYLRGV